jgi:ABC-2 type transport system permease protein
MACRRKTRDDVMSTLRDAYSLYIRELLILKKNFRSSIARSMIFPIVLILFLGNLGSSPRNTPVAIVNLAGNANAVQFMNLLESGTSGVNIVSITTQDSAMKLLANGDVLAVVVIPPNFGSSINSNVNVYIDSSSPIGSQSVEAQIQSVISSFNAHGSIQQIRGNSLSINYAFGASSSYKSFLIAGIVIMVAAFGSFYSGGMTLITDRQLGNLKAFFSAPISRTSILLSKVAYSVTQSFVNAMVALVVGLVLGGTIASGVAGLPYIIWYVLISATGFGGIATALASRVGKIEVYSIIGMAITMPLWFLSGAFLPTSTLPPIMYQVSVYNPMTYATGALRDVMLKGYLPLSTFVVTSAILIMFSIVTILISVILFKNADYK